MGRLISSFIPIRICYLKECATDKLVELRPIPTRNELADKNTQNPKPKTLNPSLFRVSNVSRTCLWGRFVSRFYYIVCRILEHIEVKGMWERVMGIGIHGHRNAMTATYVNTHF